MRKKYIAAFTAVLLIVSGTLFFVFYEGTEKEPPLDEVLKEKFTAYETDLRDSLGSMKTNTDVGNYLLSWAKNKQITAVSDANGNIIYSIPAAENTSENVQSAAVICSFDADNMEAHTEEIAAVLTIAKNTENNGSLKIIFLAEKQGNKIGAETLDTSHFDENTAVFCLGNTESARISAVTGGYQHIRFSKKLHYTEPAYGKAYKIELKNCPSLSITGEYNDGLNPIKILGGVLANFKSTSLLFELSGFHGGSDEMTTPSEASMTVVINESDISKFEKKMNHSIEKIYGKYLEEYPEIEYTYEETELPSKVIEDEDTDNLISLMYTAFNGVYSRDDEGTVIGLTNIGRLSDEDSRLKIDTAVMCSDKQITDEILETYETICGLCNMKFEVKENISIYDGSSNSETAALLDAFKQSYSDFTDKNVNIESTAVLTACSYLYEENPEMPMIFCGITSKSRHDITGAIVTWLDQSQTVNS